ncbi:hypothetical protein [Halorussus sp. AFM4]|uniref:hypothetical protein n=1 Tax=Halorussus sp. AFM4 TaxID=3421651 RepID=UPI003EC0C3B1
MADEETEENDRERRRQMERERNRETEEELERVDEEMDPEQTDQSDAATLPDDEEGDHDRTQGRHVDQGEESDAS